MKLPSLLVVVLVRLFVRPVFVFAEVKALMAYDEDTEENASESNEDQDQAAAVATKKNE